MSYAHASFYPFRKEVWLYDLSVGEQILLQKLYAARPNGDIRAIASGLGLKCQWLNLQYPNGGNLYLIEEKPPNNDWVVATKKWGKCLEVFVKKARKV